MRKLGFWGRLAVCMVKPTMAVMTKSDYRGFDLIPQGQGVILVANHISHADPFTLAEYVYDSQHWPQFLGKESLFRLPVAGKILYKCRQIPVNRGTVDAAKALDAAVEAIKANGTVVIYPEGTTTKEPELWPMRGKTGAARLALLTGAPVIPVAMWGPQDIFDPRTKKFRLRLRTPVTVTAGEQVDLAKWMGSDPTAANLAEMTDEIMLSVRDLVQTLRGGTPPPLWTPGNGRNKELSE